MKARVVDCRGFKNTKGFVAEYERDLTAEEIAQGESIAKHAAAQEVKRVERETKRVEREAFIDRLMAAEAAK